MHIKGKMSLSSRLWLNRQENDPYVKLAQKEGFRSRAVFKLAEIDDKFKIIKKSRAVIDLGAAPGGWSQLLAEKTPDDAKIAAIDLLKFDGIVGVQQFIGDFEDPENQQKILDYLGSKADLIVSDMAPNTIGHPSTDHLRIMSLVNSAYEFALKNLAQGGSFVAKIFIGGKEKDLMGRMKRDFESAQFFKPKSSRSLSSEIYVVGIKLKCS